MLKQIIEDYIDHNNSIAVFLKSTRRLYQEGENVIPKFIEKLNQTNFSSDLGNRFAETLQLSNDDKDFVQFELSDISRLYDSLLKLQESNIETIIGAAHFEFSIMDNARRAREIANAGLHMANEKTRQLEALLKEINNELNEGI